MQSLQLAAAELKHLGASQFELYTVKKTSTKIEVKEGRVDTLTQSEDAGLSIRLLDEGRMGFSFTTSLDPQAIARACQSAKEIARFMPADEFNRLGKFKGIRYPKIEGLWDESGIRAPVDRKTELARALESACRKQDRRITAVRTAGVSENIYEVAIMDQEGEVVSQRGTLFSASIMCKADQNGESQSGGDFGFHAELAHLDVESVGRQAAEYATELLGAGAAPTFKGPAILRNSVVAELVDFLSSSLSAEEIDKRRSLLENKIGETVFSPLVSIIDDGLLPGGYGTGSFDGEGTPAQRTPLVEKGRFVRPLCDLYYEAKRGWKATGCAQRSIKGPPSIGSNNLLLERGSESFDSLVKNVHNGILIVDLMGVHTANPITGDFSLGASGILIENGKLTRPVKGFAVAGNITALLRSVNAVGSDFRFFGSTGAPSVAVSELSVGGT